MAHATLFDCEYLTADGAMSRYWAGPTDPDPLVVQIGAVNLALENDFKILGSTKIHIQPLDRFGKQPKLDPFFSELTGITQTEMDDKGIPLKDALDQFEAFSADCNIWSWGKDELNLLGITCFVGGVTPPMAASRFGNAKTLMVKAGMAEEDIAATTSGQLAAHFDIPTDDQRHHDALDDALSIARTLQHLLRQGRLNPSDFRIQNHI